MDRKIAGLLESYKSWLSSSADNHPAEQRQNAQWIRDNFLDHNTLETLSDDEYEQRFKKLLSFADGPVGINWGSSRIVAERSRFSENIQYLLASGSNLDEAVKSILTGERQIDYAGRSIWSLIFSAAYESILPKVNNKTDRFFSAIGIPIGQEVSEKYLNVAKYFREWSSYDSEVDFFDIDHLMHYGTEIKEGKLYIQKNILLRDKVENYFKQNVDTYIEWQKSSSWDESYKWDILPRLAQELSQYSHANEDNIADIVEIYKRHNPSEGSFVRYTYFSDLEAGLQNNKAAVAKSMNSIWEGDYAAADTSFKIFAYNNRSLGTPGIGYFAAGRDPVNLPLFRGEFMDGLTKTLDLKLPISSNAEKYESYCTAVDIIAELLTPKLSSLGYSADFIKYPAICAQDFMYHSFFDWTNKRLLFNLQQFVNQADRNFVVSAKEADFTRKQYEMQYDNLKVTASFGQGGSSKVPWIGISFGSEYGFFPTFLYYVENKTLILAFDHSEDKDPKYTWKDVDGYPTTSEYFMQRGQSASKFVNSRVFKAYETTAPLPAHLMDDLKEILAMYRQQLDDIEKQGSQEVDILELVRKFVSDSDESIATRNQYKVDYKGVKGRAWITVRDNKRMETTWFIFGKDNNERNSTWDDDRFGLLYSLDTNKLFLAHKWPRTDRQALQDFGAEAWGNWTAYKVYDPHDIPDTFTQDFDELIKEYKEREKMISTDSKPTSLALNTILYGPPGTGKTYNAIEKYAKDLLSSQAGQEMSAEEVLASDLKGLTWWQIIAASLYAANRPLKIRDLMDMLPIRSYMTYVKGRTGSSVYDTIGTTLIERSDVQSSTTTQRREGESYFTKTNNAEWALTEEGKAFVESELSHVPVTAEPQDNSDWHKYFRTITFHQSYSYEEFIEGIRPKLDGDAGAIAYEIKDGIFKEMCELALADPGNKYLLVIDEINRGNIAKIFGELITLLEDGKRETMSVQLPYSQKNFTVPKNLYVLGTMNTADRSIALLDIALRRRFEFVELMPQPNLLTTDAAGTGLDLSMLLEQLNKKISILIDKDHQIGHSYLMDVNSVEDIESAWYKKVLPLIQEYFYNDWEKLEIVLGKYNANGTGFVRSDTVKFPGASELDDTTLYDIHKYSGGELVTALKALVVNEETPSPHAV